MEKDYISTLLRSNNTVFTFKELSLIWNETDDTLIKKRVYRYTKMGKLYTIRKGIYAKDKNYDKLELANKITGRLPLSFFYPQKAPKITNQKGSTNISQCHLERSESHPKGHLIRMHNKERERSL
jgi:hypothetical protein